MTNLIQRDKAEHWYRIDEDQKIVPWYEVPCKSKPGEFRPTTLADARKMHGALVSVGNVLKVKAKPALNDWRVEQALMAAMTTPRMDNEPDEVYVRRVIDAMEEQSTKAKDTGLEIHKIIEGYLEAKKDNVAYTLDATDPNVKLAQPCLDWIDSNVEEIYWVEEVVGNPTYEYAGRLDLKCSLATHDVVEHDIIDFKSQRVKRDSKGNPKPAFYYEWGLQLAAYAACIKDHVNLVSVIIDTSEPSKPYVHYWNDPAVRWKMFNNLLEIWKDENQWIPML